MVKDKIAFEFDKKISLAGGLEPTEEVIKLEDVRKLFWAINRLQKQKENWKGLNLRKLDELLKDFKHKLKRNYEPISYERLKEMVKKKSELDKFFVFDVRLSDLNKLLEELNSEVRNSSHA